MARGARGRSVWTPIDRGYIHGSNIWHKEIFHIDCTRGGAQQVFEALKSCVPASSAPPGTLATDRSTAGSSGAMASHGPSSSSAGCQILRDIQCPIERVWLRNRQSVRACRHHTKRTMNEDGSKPRPSLSQIRCGIFIPMVTCMLQEHINGLHVSKCRTIAESIDQ
jgi:hypothetical protein